MARVGDQEDRVDRNVTLAVWREPGGLLFSKATWEIKQGLGDGRWRGRGGSQFLRASIVHECTVETQVPQDARDARGSFLEEIAF